MCGRYHQMRLLSEPSSHVLFGETRFTVVEQTKLSSSPMRIDQLMGSVESLRRKLRAITAVVDDPAATEHEKANARALKRILQRRLNEAGSPAGDWTDAVFRLGRWAKDIHKSASPAAPKGDWTDNAHRLGKALRRGYKHWTSD